jgi:hypothetical protein
MAKRGHHGVRALGVVVLGAAVVACTWKPDCTDGTCPSYALANPWILREERVVVAVVGLLVLGLVFWRIFYHGQFPSKITKDGVEYPEVAEVAEGTTISLTALEQSLQSALEGIESNSDDIARVSDTVSAEFTRIWNAIEELQAD